MSKNEEQYWLNKEFIAELLFRLPSYIFWKDISSVYLGCNEAFARSVNLLSPNDIVGKTDYDLPWTTAESDAYRADDREVMKNGKPKLNIEENQTTREGKMITLLTSKVPLIKDGQVIGVLGIYTDITGLKNIQSELTKAKEQAESANQAKTEFVQNMQHDIRTPAAGIWGLLDTLTKSEKDPERRKILKMATESSHRLLNLCNDAVEFGDLAEHSKPVTAQKIDMRDIAKGVVELNLPAIFSKKLSLNFKINANVPQYIIGDPFRLTRILINLLGNAIKFTDKGKVSLNLQAVNNENYRCAFLVIEIRDTGIGISKDKTETVFHKFSRGVSSNTNKYPGTGLGLYVVKTFIEDLDGDIELESHEGQGSYFKLTIPFKTPHLHGGEFGPEINEEYTSPLQELLKAIPVTRTDKKEGHKEESLILPFNHKILIIEDDNVCLFAEKKIVSAFTQNIDTAGNMQEALECLKLNRYDLIISDLGLPDGSGAEIAAKVRASAESLNHKTPFIAMTAHRDKEKHQEALSAGFTETATKPLTEEKTAQLLNNYPALEVEITRSKDEMSEDLEIIDLDLTIKRLHSKNAKEAVIGLGILSESLKDDIPVLQQAQKQNDILGVREVLHKVRGGLLYSGTPCLEKAVADLHLAVKAAQALKEISHQFNIVYEQADLFEEYYQELIKE